MGIYFSNYWHQLEALLLSPQNSDIGGDPFESTSTLKYCAESKRIYNCPTHITSLNRNDGTDFDEADVKNYVCIKCRSKMANEAFITCDHVPAYCSECVANLQNCPFCETKANASRTTQP